jgi:hypothetical protein
MRKPNLFVLGAWTFYLSSWFLPAVYAQDYQVTVSGWQAFRLAACGVLPCEEVQFQTLHHLVLATFSVITTLLFLCSPWIVLRGSRSLRKVAAWIVAAAFLFNAHWIFTLGSENAKLKIGFFLWWLSFLLLAIGLFLPYGEARKESSNSVAQNPGVA